MEFTTENEIWKPCPEPFDRFEASSFGRVRFWSNPPRKLEELKDWRVIVTFRDLERWWKNKKLSVNRLVYCSMYELPLDYPMFIYHKDWNKKNNNILNLMEWTLSDMAYNKKDRWTLKIPIPNKLTKEQREKIKKEYIKFSREKWWNALWKKYWVSDTAINDIILWKSRTKDFDENYLMQK